MQAVESYRLWPEGPGFESRSPRIAQARVRLATDTLPQTPHRAGALCTGYALFIEIVFISGSYKNSDFYSFFSLLQPDIMQSAAGLIGICAANKFRDFGQWNTSNILCYSPGLFSHPANAFSCLSCISQLNTSSLWTCSFLLFFAAIFNSDFRTVAIEKEILMHIHGDEPIGKEVLMHLGDRVVW